MQATHRALAEAATDLFIRQGYAETSVDEIAEAAGVGRRTFFRYFPTKEDVFLAPALAEVADFADTLATAPDTGDPIADAAEGMRRSVEERLHHLDDSLRLYRSVRATPELRGAVRAFNLAFERCFADWYAQRTSTDPDGTDARVFATCAVGVREVALARWSEHPDIELLEHLEHAWRSLRRLASVPQ